MGYGRMMVSLGGSGVAGTERRRCDKMFIVNRNIFEIPASFPAINPLDFKRAWTSTWTLVGDYRQYEHVRIVSWVSFSRING